MEVKLRFSSQQIGPERYLPVFGLLVLGSVGAAALHYRVVERRFLALRAPRPFLANSRLAPSDWYPTSKQRDLKDAESVK
jgi:hypothetical protein